MDSGLQRNDGRKKDAHAFLASASRRHPNPRSKASLELPATDGRIWTPKATLRSEWSQHAPKRRSRMIAKATASSAMAVRIERP
jgi:hypothetical protein